MKTITDVLHDIGENMIGISLSSISGQATPFTIDHLDEDQRRYYVRLENGKIKSRPYDELERIWQEMTSKPAVHVESFLGGSGSMRNQPETVLANLPYVEWLQIGGKKHIAYVDDDTHAYGTIKKMDEERTVLYQAALNSPHPRNPILDDYDQDDTNRKTGGFNLLLYGVPGAGKSHTVRQMCNNPQLMEVIVFHPDYTNSDFVGQILPKAEGDKVTYQFAPGPFTRILQKANDTPGMLFYLVIEEINRGNAPAIFGEIFQLLDRETSGESKYTITNPDIAKVVFNGDASRPIKIPSNLVIVATMNTSDQNVFTLDTAFQRRWHMRMIPNEIDKAEHAKKPILDTRVSWATFCNRVNGLILDSNLGMASSEDKRLGAYFLLPEDIVYDDRQTEEANLHNRLFADKAIKYLWDDAFKFHREALFNPKYTSLEKVLLDFESKKGFDRFSVFNKGIFTEDDLLPEPTAPQNDQQTPEQPAAEDHTDETDTVVVPDPLAGENVNETHDNENGQGEQS